MSNDWIERILNENSDGFHFVILDKYLKPINKKWKTQKADIKDVLDHRKIGGDLGLYPYKMGFCVFDLRGGNPNKIAYEFGSPPGVEKGENGQAQFWYEFALDGGPGGKFDENSAWGDLRCKNWLSKSVSDGLIQDLWEFFNVPPAERPSKINVPVVSMTDEQIERLNKRLEESKAKKPTQYDLTSEFVGRASENLRYSHLSKKWYFFNGKFWVDGYVGSAAQAMQVIQESSYKAHQTLSFTRGVIGLASMTEKMQVDLSMFDSKPFLVGMKNCIFDLEKKRFRNARFDDFITLSTGVDIAEKDSELWLKFLSDFMPDNATRYYLQLLFGQALIGRQIEHIVPFLVGTGKNGKTVFIEAIKAAVGSYAGDLDSENLIQVSGVRHTTDWAAVAGKRLVVVDEMPENAVWNMSRIKQVSGGGELTARFLYQDNFTFQPRFTMFVLANDKPRLRTVDDSVKRRLRLIPCTFKPEKPDTALGQKLKNESSGVLKWLIDGAIEYIEKYMLQGKQLGLPKLVAEYTQSYFDLQDVVLSFVGDSKENADCPLYFYAPGRIKRSEVLEAAREAMPMMRWTQPKLAQALEKHGIVARKYVDGWNYCGLEWTDIAKKKDDLLP